MRRLALLAAFAPLPLLAQTAAPPARPATGTAGQEQPAVRVAPREDLRDDSGTTIVGERESPIGLYITPWRNAFAEQDIDRPARLLRVDMDPIDRDVFARQVEYHEALAGAAQSKRTPLAPPPPAAKP